MCEQSLVAASLKTDGGKVVVDEESFVDKTIPFSVLFSGHDVFP